MGIRNRNQQINFKNVSFKFCSTALVQKGGFIVLLQGATVDTCAVGVDTTAAGQLGSLIVLDSTSINSGPMVKFQDSSRHSGDRNQQIIIENLSYSGNNPVAVASDGSVKLASMRNVDTWVWGNVDPGVYQAPKTLTTSRSPQLLSNAKFSAMVHPTYQDYSADQVANVKADISHP